MYIKGLEEYNELVTKEFLKEYGITEFDSKTCPACGTKLSD